MKNVALMTLGALTLVASAARAQEVAGSYVEARSLSVWAGACHFNAEVTTAGREAVLAWSFSRGTSDGVSLAGVRALAVVAGDANLAEKGTGRRSILYIDAPAAAQRTAVAALLKSRAGSVLGTVIDVRAAPVSFRSDKTAVQIGAAGSAVLEAKPYKCEHCRMPAQLWYSPLAPTAHAEVAQGTRTGFTEKALGVSWSHEPADNVFIGDFVWKR